MKTHLWAALAVVPIGLAMATACGGVPDGVGDLADPDGAEVVVDCPTMCTYADDAGNREASCTVDLLVDLNYDLLGAPYGCAAIAGSAIGCNACMGDLAVTAEDCVLIYEDCF